MTAIEDQNVTKATCGACGRVDYAPRYELPGLVGKIEYKGRGEDYYACRVAHAGRAARTAADKLATEHNGSELAEPEPTSTS